MLSIIDRYLLRSLLTNYLIALGTMLSLYIALDMFVNMDEFTEEGHPLPTVLGNIVSYYWPNVFYYFSELSGVITLFACMAVLARMRRLNELTAILASGVSLYRIARPIILFGLATTMVLAVNTEWIIPSVAHLLARKHEEAGGRGTYEVLFLPDRDGALLSAGGYDPTTRDLHRMLVLRCDEAGEVIATVEADRAVWESPTQTRPVGRWRLERGVRWTRERAAGAAFGPRGTAVRDLVQYYESDLNPEAIQLRQAEGWDRYLSLSQLSELLESGIAERLPVIRARHARIAMLATSFILLLLGLPFFLDRSGDNVLGDAGKCMIACGLCYVTSFVAQSVRQESESAFATWVPIFIFTTLAVVLLDRIRT